MSFVALEDFGLAQEHPIDVKTEQLREKAVQEEVDVNRREAYELGYKEGHAVALLAAERECEAQRLEALQGLQNISCNYLDAHAHVMNSLKPFLTSIIENILPKIARDTLALTISENIVEFLEGSDEEFLELTSSPDNLELVQEVASENVKMAIAVKADSDLSNNQFALNLGARERRIDLDAAIENINKEILSFYEMNKEILSDAK